MVELKVFHVMEAAINDQCVAPMVARMTPDATVTWLNGDVFRHDQIRAYYQRMVKGTERILLIRLEGVSTCGHVGARSQDQVFHGAADMGKGRKLQPRSRPLLGGCLCRPCAGARPHRRLTMSALWRARHET